MKDSTDAKEKTSRRSFAKSVATALVAAPVVSSLSSCQKGITTVAPSLSPYLEASNPPVIIDGGSFQVMIPATLDKRSDDNVPPKKYKNRFYQRKDGSLGAIDKIHIIDDYAFNRLAEYSLNGQTLQVQIWIAKATEAGDYENDTDTATYDPMPPIPPERVPDIVIQGGKIEIRMDKDLDNDNKRKIFKHGGRNQRRYHIHDWDGGGSHSPFRLTKVKVLVGSSQTVQYDSDRDPISVDNGFRIILILKAP